ncbi:8-oxo-dGTP pyrophosphatase MutT (NUDIX family) [Micromonospora sp. Llam0]|uniref:NUDIX domain-containing protein n=1 Tax=Micromonospora sp. Llam0 TaxID=2485143 RepID=UPI000F47572A|nr:NUDIX domain-containing protein [Micromonospora sp. Llam0]ROO51624.1 8-oxo-dGTP pyrophosphatase MutT (NUDIX family) [Micromonospora sp. Llam0]
MTVKHATAGAFVFHRFSAGWRLGLIEHPRLHRHMIMGGHVESFETQVEAALREVEEESGLHRVRLINPPTPDLPTNFPFAPVAAPWWIVEQDVPPDSHLAEPHIHIDHQYVAVADDPGPAGTGEHRFDWFGPDELPQLSMFDDTRVLATVLFSCLDDVVGGVVDPITAIRPLVAALT